MGGGDIRRNPHVATGKDGCIDCFERMAAEYPGKRARVKRAVLQELPASSANPNAMF